MALDDAAVRVPFNGTATCAAFHPVHADFDTNSAGPGWVVVYVVVAVVPFLMCWCCALGEQDPLERRLWYNPLWALVFQVILPRRVEQKCSVPLQWLLVVVQLLALTLYIVSLDHDLPPTPVVPTTKDACNVGPGMWYALQGTSWYWCEEPDTLCVSQNNTRASCDCRQEGDRLGAGVSQCVVASVVVNGTAADASAPTLPEVSLWGQTWVSLIDRTGATPVLVPAVCSSPPPTFFVSFMVFVLVEVGVFLHAQPFQVAAALILGIGVVGGLAYWAVFLVVIAPATFVWRLFRENPTNSFFRALLIMWIIAAAAIGAAVGYDASQLGHAATRDEADEDWKQAAEATFLFLLHIELLRLGREWAKVQRMSQRASVSGTAASGCVGRRARCQSCAAASGPALRRALPSSHQVVN